MRIRHGRAIVVALILARSAAHAGDGQLDATFGDQGRTYLGWDADSGVTAYDAAIAVLALADNSVILVGNATDAGAAYGSYNAIGIAKVTPAGTFDTTFGDAATPGQTKIHGGGASDQIVATSAALQADGKIVIVGNSSFSTSGKQMATVWRLNANGSPDTGFGFAGTTIIDRNIGNQFDSATAVTIVRGVQGTPYAGLEGRIVVAGSNDFSHDVVISESWIFQLDTLGLPVANNGAFLGAHTFNWSATDCEDGYHDQTFSAIRLNVQPDTGVVTYFLAGNCVPRAGTGRLYLPYIAAVDPTLNLVQSFGNNENGISEISYQSSTNNYSDVYVTALDVSPDARNIVFTGVTPALGSTRQIFEGALSGDGQFNGGWSYGGARALSYGGDDIARAILVDPHPTALFPFQPTLIAGEVNCSLLAACGGDTGTSHFWVGSYYFGTPVSYCGNSDGSQPCFYKFNSATQGINAMTFTPSGKVVVAGYVYINGHEDFAVMRLQRDEIFFNGFGYPSQGFQ